MAYRDVYGESLREDRTLPSGIRPIIGLLLSIIAIAGWLFLARVDPANVQVPSAQ